MIYINEVLVFASCFSIENLFLARAKANQNFFSTVPPHILSASFVIHCVGTV